MGNRAVITTSTEHYKGTGIYLHWNGGIESILAFLAAAKERKYRDPESDPHYSLARLTGLLHEFFGVHNDTSIGIGAMENLDCDNYDNGVYIIGRNWEIIGRYGKGSSPLDHEANYQVKQSKKCQEIINSLRLEPATMEAQ